MATLSDKFHALLKEAEVNPELHKEAAKIVLDAPDSPEKEGLLGLMYHEGIGIPVDFDRCFEHAEKAVDTGGDPLGYFLLGYMCDNIETPDQADGGPRQKYDHYDAERFYEKCAEQESRWKEYACLWLGDYFLDFAQGGDPDVGVEYYEQVAEFNADAAAALSDYYWDLIMPLYLEDDEWRAQLFKWTKVAAELDPEEYSYRMGWIYADGLGCEKDDDMAIEYFKTAYGYDDWRGAKAIAKIYEERMEENPDLSDRDRKNYEKTIKFWTKKGDEIYQRNIRNHMDELDMTVKEED